MSLLDEATDGTTLSEEYGLLAHFGTSDDPETDFPNALAGEEYTSAVSGRYWKRQVVSGTLTWIELGATGGGGGYWYAGSHPTTLAGYGITDALPIAGGTVTGALTVQGILQTTSAYGFALGELANVPRMRYGASTATSFDLLTGPGAYAALYLGDVHTSRDATSGAAYFGSDGGVWLYRHGSTVDLHAANLDFMSGYGLTSAGNGGATLSFAAGAPAYLDFYSGDTTVAGLRMYFNGAIRGYLYANANGIGFLNDQGNWSVRCFYGTGYGGVLTGNWSATGTITATDFVLG